MPPFYFLTFAKVSVSVSKKFGLKKVSVSVSKTFGLEKKSRYRSRKHLVSKKSLGIGLENIWSQKKSLGLGLKNFGLEKKSRYRSRWNFLVSSLSGRHKNVFRVPRKQISNKIVLWNRVQISKCISLADSGHSPVWLLNLLRHQYQQRTIWILPFVQWTPSI